MPDFECPECGGGFPTASHNGACPWCGEAIDSAGTAPVETVPNNHTGGVGFGRKNDLGTSTTPDLDPDVTTGPHGIGGSR